MEKEKHILINHIHRYFGVEFNNKAWTYFEKESRTADEDDDMTMIAHSSLLHWKLFSGGTIVNVQRGEYMVAKAYCLAGNKEEALSHANKCFLITESNLDEMKDFDIAFAHEIMAIANRLCGNEDEFNEHKELAEKKGNEIKDEEDRKIFFETYEKYISPKNE